MKILLLADRLHWSYHAIGKSIQKYNDNSDVSIKVMHIKGNVPAVKKAYKKYDRILVMGWQTFEKVNFLPKKNTMIGIHSFHGWDNRKTTPEKSAKPSRKLVDFLSVQEKLSFPFGI